MAQMESLSGTSKFIDPCFFSLKCPTTPISAHPRQRSPLGSRNGTTLHAAKPGGPPRKLVRVVSWLYQIHMAHSMTWFSKANLNDRLFFWSCIATLFSTALSIFLFTTSMVGDSSHAKHSQKILRRPSTYINLDKVLANSNHTFPPLTNFPQMVYQISASDSSRRMSEDHKSRRTDIGTIYPDLRHIHVTNQVSIPCFLCP